MAQTVRTVFIAFGATVLPCLLQSVIVVMDEERLIPSRLSEAGMLASLAIGYVFAVRIRRGNQVLVAVIYLPWMLVMLYLVTVTIIGVDYGGPSCLSCGVDQKEPGY